MQANSQPRYGLIVHSNGTRFESHRFRIDFAGSTKYSGRSSDFLRVVAGGEDAARRAMPTSRALARSCGAAAASRVQPFARFWESGEAEEGGGQSAVGQPELLPPGLLATVASTVLRSHVTKAVLRSHIKTASRTPVKRPAIPSFRLWSSGHSGKRLTVVGKTRERGVREPGADRYGTGGIAH